MSVDLMITEFQQRGVSGLEKDFNKVAKSADKADDSLLDLTKTTGSLGKNTGGVQALEKAILELGNEIDRTSRKADKFGARKMGVCGSGSGAAGSDWSGAGLPGGVTRDKNGRLRLPNGRFYNDPNAPDDDSGGLGVGSGSGSSGGGSKSGKGDGPDFGKLEQAGDKLLMAGGLLAGGMVFTAKLAIDAGGKVESTTAGFKSLLGSADAAEKKIKEIQEFAKNSPFNFAESAEAAQSLKVMGFAADDLIPILKKVGNATAAGGKSTEEFKGILMALGQIKTKGKLSAEELQQIAERGINPFDILKEKLKLTDEQIQNIGESGIDTNTALQALIDGMGEVAGGTAMADQMETLPAIVSQTQESFESLGVTINEVFGDDIKAGAKAITNMTTNLGEFIKEHEGLVKAGVGATAVAAGGLLVGGAYLKAKGAAGGLAELFGDVAGAAGKSKKAKDGLTKSTLADAAAEKLKTGIAGDEASALLDTADAAKEAAENKGILAKAGGAFANFKNFIKSPVGGLGVSGGLALTSAAVGAAAGYGASDDYKAMGFSDTQANMAGGATGVGAAVAMMFIPGAAVPVALATGFRYLFNEMVNRPMELAAEKGSGLDEETSAKFYSMSNSEKSEAWKKKADEAQAEEDAGPGLWARGTAWMIGRDLDNEAAGKHAEIQNARLNERKYRSAAPVERKNGKVQVSFAPIEINDEAGKTNDDMVSVAYG